VDTQEAQTKVAVTSTMPFPDLVSWTLDSKSLSKEGRNAWSFPSLSLSSATILDNL